MYRISTQVRYNHNEGRASLAAAELISNSCWEFVTGEGPAGGASAGGMCRGAMASLGACAGGGGWGAHAAVQVVNTGTEGVPRRAHGGGGLAAAQRMNNSCQEILALVKDQHINSGC